MKQNVEMYSTHVSCLTFICIIRYGGEHFSNNSFLPTTSATIFKLSSNKLMMNIFEKCFISFFMVKKIVVAGDKCLVLRPMH